MKILFWNFYYSNLFLSICLPSFQWQYYPQFCWWGPLVRKLYCHPRAWRAVSSSGSEGYEQESRGQRQRLLMFGKSQGRRWFALGGYKDTGSLISSEAQTGKPRLTLTLFYSYCRIAPPPPSPRLRVSDAVNQDPGSTCHGQGRAKEVSLNY